MARETPRVFIQAERIVRRFLADDASPEELGLVVFWVMQQPIAFVRNADRLSGPPFNLGASPASVDRLAETLTRLCLGGLHGLTSS